MYSVHSVYFKLGYLDILFFTDCYYVITVVNSMVEMVVLYTLSVWTLTRSSANAKRTARLLKKY